MRERLTNLFFFVVGGVVTALLVGWWQAWVREPSVSISYSWTTFDSLRGFLSDSDLIKALPSTTPLGPLGAAAKSSYGITLYEVVIANNGNSKLRGIEIYVPTPYWAIIFPKSESRKLSPIVPDSDQLSPLRFLELTPDESVRAIIVAERSFFGRPAITALYEGRRMSVIPLRWDEREGFFGIRSWIAYYGEFGEIAVFLLGLFGGGILLLVVVAGILPFFIRDKVAFQAKLTSTKQLENYEEILKYAEKHFPERLSKRREDRQA